MVDNTSGANWRGVQLSFVSDSSLASKYNLHTPRNVERYDMIEVDQQIRPAVAVGEISVEICTDSDVLVTPSSNANEFHDDIGEGISGGDVSLRARSGAAHGIDGSRLAKLEDSMLALTRAVSASGLTR